MNDKVLEYLNNGINSMTIAHNDAVAAIQNIIDTIGDIEFEKNGIVINNKIITKIYHRKYGYNNSPRIDYFNSTNNAYYEHVAINFWSSENVFLIIKELKKIFEEFDSHAKKIVILD